MASIYKRSWTTSRGEIRTVWRIAIMDGNGKKQRRQFATRGECERYRVEIEGQLRAGTFRPDANKITLKETADQFLVHCEARMKRRERMTRRNYKTYEGHIRNYICVDPKRHAGKKAPPKRLRAFDGSMSNVTLGQLTAKRIGDFRDRLRDAGVSVPTTRKILATLQQVLAFAIGRDLIAVNAARGVKVIGRRDEGARKIVPPSKVALRRLLEVADADFKVKLTFAAATGVRAGELHALRWHHVDFERGEVKIETRVDAYHEEDVTKTAAGMRTIPIASSVVTLLKEWKLRAKWKKAEHLVFPSKRGFYVTHDNMIKRHFNPLFERLAKLNADDPAKHPEAPARFNWHALRHFAVSCWIDAGLAPKTVQTFAGHSSLQVTMDRYGHLFKSDDHKAAMDAIAGEILGK